MRNSNIAKRSVLGSFAVKHYVKKGEANLSIGGGIEDRSSLAVGLLRALGGRSRRSLRCKGFKFAELPAERP
jgi:hypothetical protein